MYVPILGTTWVATSLLATHLIKRNFSTQNTAANATSQELEQDPYQLLSKIRYDGNQLIEPELKAGPRKFRPFTELQSKL